MSVFLMGVYDKSRDKFCTVAKCGNGHDDSTLAKLQKELDMVKISKVYNIKNLITVNCTQGIYSTYKISSTAPCKYTHIVKEKANFYFKITHNVRLIIGNPSSVMNFYYATYLDYLCVYTLS